MAKKKQFDMGQLEGGLASENPFDGFSSGISGADIFGDEMSPASPLLSKVKDIPIGKLKPSPRNPYNVVADSDEMKTLVASIKKEGVLNPLVVRPLDGGDYEIISGHRRRCAAEMAGVSELPCYVRNLTDEEADRIMVDLNLNRENILPSEKARAVALKYEALKKGRGRKKAGEEAGHDTAKIVAEEMGMSERAIQNYVRLTFLSKSLSDAMDRSELAQKAAIQLSFLADKAQEMVFDAAKKKGVQIDEGLAKDIKAKLQKLKDVTEKDVEAIFGKEEKPKKKSAEYKPMFKMSKSVKSRYFDKDMTDRQIDDIIEKLLKDWAKKNS